MDFLTRCSFLKYALLLLDENDQITASIQFPSSNLQICDTLLLNISTEELSFDSKVSLFTIWREYDHRMALIALTSHPIYHFIRGIGFLLDTIVLLLIRMVRMTHFTGIL